MTRDACTGLLAAAEAVLEASDGLHTLEGRQQLSDELDLLAVAVVVHGQQTKA